MYDLERFVEAQDETYSVALKEIKDGRKRTHWIWYIFPQIEGLGISYMTQRYSIKDINEAREYLNNEILYNHLIEICEALLNLNTDDITTIMDEPDDMKLRSSMTLFLCARPDCEIFRQVLEKFYSGIMDEETIKILTKTYTNK